MEKYIKLDSLLFERSQASIFSQEAQDYFFSLVLAAHSFDFSIYLCQLGVAESKKHLPFILTE